MSRQIAGLVVAVLAPLVLSAAAVATDKPAAGTVASLAYGQDVDVATGGTRLRLRLTDVHDSRCPALVECVWAGVATVTVHVAPVDPDKATAPIDVTLSLPGEAQIAFGGRLALDSLEPRPSTRGGSLPTAYVANVRISASAIR